MNDHEHDDETPAVTVVSRRRYYPSTEKLKPMSLEVLADQLIYYVQGNHFNVWLRYTKLPGPVRREMLNAITAEIDEILAKKLLDAIVEFRRADNAG